MTNPDERITPWSTNNPSGRTARSAEPEPNPSTAVRSGTTSGPADIASPSPSGPTVQAPNATSWPPTRADPTPVHDHPCGDKTCDECYRPSTFGPIDKIGPYLLDGAHAYWIPQDVTVGDEVTYLGQLGPVRKVGSSVQFSYELLGQTSPDEPTQSSTWTRVRRATADRWWALRRRVGYAIAGQTPEDW